MDKYKLLKDSFPVNILGNCLSPTDVQNLGILFDSEFGFNYHVSFVIKSCFANLCDFYCIQNFISYYV